MRYTENDPVIRGRHRCYISIHFKAQKAETEKKAASALKPEPEHTDKKITTLTHYMVDF